MLWNLYPVCFPLTPILHLLALALEPVVLKSNSIISSRLYHSSVHYEILSSKWGLTLVARPFLPLRIADSTWKELCPLLTNTISQLHILIPLTPSLYIMYILSHNLSQSIECTLYSFVTTQVTTAIIWNNILRSLSTKK